MNESERPFSSMRTAKDVQQELDDELDLHLALMIDELVAQGMSPKQARAEAEQRFGRTDELRTDCTRIGVTQLRAARRADWRMQFLQDLRIGARGLLRSPGFTFVAVVILALGFGANTAMFSVIRAVFLRPLPFNEPDRLVTIWQTNAAESVWRGDVSLPNFKDWQEQSESFESMALIQPYGFDLIGYGDPVALSTSQVSADFFRVLGVEAMHGRTFTAEDVAQGRFDLVVIGHGVWQRYFAGDPGCVNRTVQLDGTDFTIIGIMPPDFDFPAERVMWTPLIELERLRRNVDYMNVIARLKPGVDHKQAQSELDTIAERLAEAYPRTNKGSGAAIVPMHGHLVEQARPALLTLYAAVGFVLLIACFNVVQLQFVRGTRRRRELAVRSALGAARGRLIRQLLTESLLLFVCGGAVGLVLAYAGVMAIRVFSPANVPRLEHVNVDLMVLLYSMGVMLVAAFLFGIFPAFRASRVNVIDVIKDAGSTSTEGPQQGRLGSLLVIGEVTAAMVLLVGAVLLIRSFVGLISVDPGFRPDHTLALEIHAFGDRTPVQRVEFFRNIEESVKTLPGVLAVGSVSTPPFHEMSIDIDTTFTITGRGETIDDTPPKIILSSVTPGYFAATRIQLVDGRLLDEIDAEAADPVILINDTVARRHWPDESPVGQIITLALAPDTPFRIVGVVGSVLHTGLDTSAWPECFMLHAQNPSGSMVMMVRARGDAMALIPAIKKVIWANDPNLPISSIYALDDLVEASVAHLRFSTSLLAGMAALALLLASLGLYGVIAYSVSQRGREIGLRIALGASTRMILVQVLRHGALLATIGVVIGVGTALTLARLLESQLYHVSPSDPMTYVGLSLLFLVVALGACFVPARRATKVDPMVALRNE